MTPDEIAKRLAGMRVGYDLKGYREPTRTEQDVICLLGQLAERDARIAKLEAALRRIISEDYCCQECSSYRVAQEALKP